MLQWGDDMTLDYNFQANFWGCSTANRPELVLLYAATLLDSRLVQLGRDRASSTAWAMGGWPDQYGAEVMGMSCGPTPDWDHGFGCEAGFGGFDGVAFASCCGPFRGMECSFDDGTRFVAGLAATPLLQYYDATQDRAFLLHRLMPFIEQVRTGPWVMWWSSFIHTCWCLCVHSIRERSGSKPLGHAVFLYSYSRFVWWCPCVWLLTGGRVLPQLRHVECLSGCLRVAVHLRPGDLRLGARPTPARGRVANRWRLHILEQNLNSCITSMVLVTVPHSVLGFIF